MAYSRLRGWWTTEFRSRVGFQRHIMGSAICIPLKRRSVRPAPDRLATHGYMRVPGIPEMRHYQIFEVMDVSVGTEVGDSACSASHVSHQASRLRMRRVFGT
jgi:hypothetical protein